ncbi:ABC transporter substrate-binding protein [bacterium]|nr:ABC transporter substrate-binding protein [bacterium]
MKKQRVLILAAILAMSGLLMAAGSLMAKVKDEVRVALMYEPSTLNMLEIKTGIELPVIMVMHEALLVADPVTGERTLENSLSESMEILPDNKSIRIRLRKGAMFHTGDPVTAVDVKFTFEQAVNPKNANLMAAALDEIEEIEVLDDYNLIIHLYEPYAAWRELLWLGICSKKYYERVGRETFRKHPVGSGPFKFKERKSGEYVLMEAFTEHPVWKTEFKYLKFMVVPDDVTRLALLETGELDLVSDILPHHVKRLKRNAHVVVKREASVPSLYGLAVKPDNYPVFKDPNVGLAMRYGVNRQEIVDRVFLGEGYPLYSYASKSELGYDPDLSFAYDPDKARQYLKKSIYKPGDPLLLTYTSAVPNARMIAAMLQRYLGQIGMTIKLQQLEAGVQATYTRNRDPREGHMTLYSWGGGRDPSTRLLLSVTSDSPYTSYSNRPRQKELDTLVKKQAREMDPVKRLELLKRVHAIMTEDAAGIILCGANMIYAHSDQIEYNWTPNESFTFNLHRVKIVK